MPLTDPVAITVILASCLAAGVSAAFALGGGFVFLAVIGVVMPIDALVPMHAAVLIGSLVSRVAFFWRDIAWRIVAPFSFGCVIGSVVGARIYVDASNEFIGTGIAVVMLLAAWLPDREWKFEIPHPFFLLGILHSLLSTLFAVGALLQPLVLRMRLNRQQISATIAGSMLTMQVAKVAGYAVWGFDFRPYLALILVSWAAAVPGAWFGKRFLNTLPEHLFQNVFRILITLLALRLLYRAWLAP